MSLCTVLMRDNIYDGYVPATDVSIALTHLFHKTTEVDSIISHLPGEETEAPGG